MCGIAGIIRWSGPLIEKAEIQRMTGALAHRGPDGSAVDARDPAATGNARLAIIDPAGGAQPMQAEDGNATITYNGALYNFRELRAELTRLGHSFRTDCDTEVVLRSWLQWGERCVERFRGMFAFAALDRRAGRLFLARDHFGIKPLVYFATAERFCFASEIQALRQLHDFPTGLDLEALDQYLALSYIPAPRTIYTAVRKLPPAHHLTVGFDGQTSGPVRYWKLDFQPRSRGSLDDWAEELDHVVRASVRAHLVADVPFGAFLSGGIDSSLVVSLMAQEMGQPVQTFTIGFDDPASDETAFAQIVADRWETLHTERIVASDALAILPELVTHYGEPFGDWSAIPVYHLAALARERVTMALSGDGGDEAFGGYRRYWKPVPRLDRLRSLLGRGPDLDWQRRVMTVLDAPARRALWRPELGEMVPDDVEPVATPWLQAADASPFRRAQSVDYQTYLPGAILTKVDIASMIHGLEVRTPLVDREVVEFAATIPTRMLGPDAWRQGSAGKRVVKQLLARWFPPEFTRRPKMGFAPPVAVWFSPGNPVRQEAIHALTDRDARIADYFLPAEIERRIAAMDRGGPAEPVWLLLFFERWLEPYGR